MSLILLPPYKKKNSLSDALFAQNQFLLKASQGKIDLMAKTAFDARNDVALSSAQAKFGTQSLFYAGNGSTGLVSSAGIGGQLPITGFTVEAWIYIPSSSAGGRIILANRVSSAATAVNFAFYLNGSHQVCFANNIERVRSTAQVPRDVWVHVAVCHEGGVRCHVSINGVVEAVASNWGVSYTATSLAVGSYVDMAAPFNGYIDSVRATKAYRYASNFTPTEFATS